MRSLTHAVSVLAALSLAGCKLTDRVSERVGGAQDELRLSELKSGVGQAAATGGVVTVHYTVRSADGRKIASTHDLNRPQSFPLGSPAVIPGLSQGIVGMRPGGIRQLIIPGALAYGGNGLGDAVKPNAQLTFEVELVSLK